MKSGRAQKERKKQPQHAACFLLWCTCVSASVRQSRAPNRAWELCCKILLCVPPSVRKKTENPREGGEDGTPERPHTARTPPLHI